MNKSNLFNSSDLGLRIIFLKQLLVDILPLGSVSVDPHIFEDLDLDPGRQILADPTDPDPDLDPKHWTGRRLYQYNKDDFLF